MTGRKIIRAALLWIVLPWVATKAAAQHWRGTLAALAVAAAVAALATTRTGATEPHAPPGSAQVIANDLTAAFATGIDKNTPNRYIVLHHTASNGDNRISDIARTHLGEHQWSKIGYHYFIDNGNQVWRLLPENESAPNAFHRNNDAVAICLAGNYSESTPSDTTLDVLAALVRIVMRTNGIAPENVIRHCDVPDNATECCGRNFNIVEFRKKLY